MNILDYHYKIVVLNHKHVYDELAIRGINSYIPRRCRVKYSLKIWLFNESESFEGYLTYITPTPIFFTSNCIVLGQDSELEVLKLLISNCIEVKDFKTTHYKPEEKCLTVAEAILVSELLS